MINAPKRLWHHCLVVIDEADKFCPETTKCESKASVIDLMCRGRKRGYGGVLATQRISKLSKDAAAETNNKLTGRTGQDVDMKRAGDDLGFSSKQDTQALRYLKAGSFYGFGPAFGFNGVEKMHIGSVETTHPKVTDRIMIPTVAPSDKMKKIFSQLEDLSSEAEKELETIEDLKEEVRSLNTQLKAKPKPEIDRKELVILREKLVRAIKEKKLADQCMHKFKKEINSFAFKLSEISDKTKIISEGLAKTEGSLNAIESDLGSSRPSLPINDPVNILHSYIEPSKRPDIALLDELTSGQKFAKEMGLIRVKNAGIDAEYNVVKPLGKCTKMAYAFLKTNPDKEFSNLQIGLLTGYSPTSGGFKNSLSILNSRELIIIDKGMSRLNPETVIDIQEKGHVFSIDLIKEKLPRCEGEIFDVVLDHPDNEFTNESLSEYTATGYSPTSGGFKNGISRLNKLGFITRNRGMIKLSDDVREML